jgi:hypothetical protein
MASPAATQDEVLFGSSSSWQRLRWGRELWPGNELIGVDCRGPDVGSRSSTGRDLGKMIGTVLRSWATRASRPAELNGKHALKERAVTLERDTQVFGRYVVAFIPLLLQFRSRVGETLR